MTIWCGSTRRPVAPTGVITPLLCWPAHFEIVELMTLICLGIGCAGIGAWTGAQTQKQERQNIMAKISELATTLNGLVQKAEAQIEKSDKILAEVTKLKADFEALKATLENVEIPAEAQAAIVALDARLDTIAAKQAATDDVNPDAA